MKRSPTIRFSVGEFEDIQQNEVSWQRNNSALQGNTRPVDHYFKATVTAMRLESEYVRETSEKLIDKAQEVAREAITGCRAPHSKWGPKETPAFFGTTS